MRVKGSVNTLLTMVILVDEKLYMSRRDGIKLPRAHNPSAILTTNWTKQYWKGYAKS